MQMLQAPSIPSGVVLTVAVCALAVGVQSRHLLSRFTAVREDSEPLGCESAWPHLRTDCRLSHPGVGASASS